MNQQDLELVDEQLTAYLDGELTPQDAKALEQSLIVDQKLRLRLAELRKAYDLLDEIPETPHNQRFTKSTMELVIKDLSTGGSSVVTAPTKSSGRIDWLSWPRVLILLGALTATGSLVAFAVSFRNQQVELGNMGLFANVQGLKDVNDLEIAIKLSLETEVMAVLKERFGDEVVPPPPVSLWERKDWVQSLTPTQITRLKSGRDMLNKMDRGERVRWTSIESKIESSANSNQIQEAIHLIGKVMDVKARARQELESMNQEQRIAFLRNELCYQAAEYYAQHMPPADAKALSDWDVGSLNPALIQDHPSSRFTETSALLLRLWYLKRPGFDGQDELIDELVPMLTKTGGKIIEGISRKDEQVLMLLHLLFPDKVPSEKSLLDSYENLDKGGRITKEKRDKVDLGAPEKFKDNLREALGPRSRP